MSSKNDPGGRGELPKVKALAIGLGLLSPLLLLPSPFAIYYGVQARKQGFAGSAWIGLLGGGFGAFVLSIAVLGSLLSSPESRVAVQSPAAPAHVRAITHSSDALTLDKGVSDSAADRERQRTAAGQRAASDLTSKLAEAEALAAARQWTAADESYQAALREHVTLRNNGDPLPGFDGRQEAIIEKARRKIAPKVAAAKVAVEREAARARVGAALKAADAAIARLEAAVAEANVADGQEALQASTMSVTELDGLGAPTAKVAALKKRLSRSDLKLQRIAEAQAQARARAERKAAAQRELARKKGPRPKESAWDGVVPCVKYWMKQNLKDPDSFDVIEASPVADLPAYWVQRVKYRARNSFGGYVIEEKLIGFWNTDDDLMQCSIQEVGDL